LEIDRHYLSCAPSFFSFPWSEVPKKGEASPPPSLSDYGNPPVDSLPFQARDNFFFFRSVGPLLFTGFPLFRNSAPSNPLLAESMRGFFFFDNLVKIGWILPVPNRSVVLSPRIWPPIIPCPVSLSIRGVPSFFPQKWAAFSL